MFHNAYTTKQCYLADKDATDSFAQNLAEYWLQSPVHTRPKVWYLQGDLGAGKTSFSQAFIRGLLKDPTLRVKSPTYTLLESYATEVCYVLHADLYRLVEAEELEYLGFRDFEQQADVILLEWPSKAGGLLPVPDIILDLSIHETGRYISLQSIKMPMQLWLSGFKLS
ncbi:tRNA (adenosine(37)-N6)-threonylcarbamoyltransferase complex ATPase subunit type 1 TsaE [Thiomicrospira sp. ALE5]|uniref:tRNA (adenosine(37)-N6)-threonylcarbamoyltransferase complex ATPase subunit type 1 TsaE n=1 Tax=Thiomicrospira sp. ALE5 TaxID=748650 RepID=UPI0008E05FC2|nr:tRNA (adenosine(37)-N6)-threonylcarbamoyltransferase complex ATPase subunit type 1 TsaE [Thiomicrospira sp. ALE5]SFR59087.1 tRNA threonylcarbamoyladenosine biosynthesis protein TsaE [Thiomicrospira sp. ALE5]